MYTYQYDHVLCQSKLCLNVVFMLFYLFLEGYQNCAAIAFELLE